MARFRKGKQTFVFEKPPYIVSTGAVGGKRESEGPLAAAFEGLHRQTGLVLALVMFFVYYSLMSFGFSMGEAGTVPPAIGLWIPNALFFFAGLYGIRLAERERAPRIVSLLALLRGRKAA